MEFPMRMYGLNIFEYILTDLLAAVGWLILIGTAATSVLWPEFYPSGSLGGILAASTAFLGILLLVGSGGVRGNREAVDAGYGLWVLIVVGWIANGLFPVRTGPLLVGIVLVIILVALRILHYQANVARFSPRFLSMRQFETMIAVAETMIETDGEDAVPPIEVAIRVDRLLSQVDSPVAGDLKTALIVTEWLLPLLIFRPLPFSDLGPNTRRRAVEAVIDGKGIFRTLARTLKVTAGIGYYSSPEARGQVGYVEFDLRARARGVDQSPQVYPDPFPGVIDR